MMANPTMSDPVDLNVLLAAMQSMVDALGLAGQRVQQGTFTVAISATAADVTQVFAEPFGGPPRVFCSVMPLAAGNVIEELRWGTSPGSTDGVGSPTSFSLRARRVSGSSTIRVNWLAIGPA